MLLHMRFCIRDVVNVQLYTCCKISVAVYIYGVVWRLFDMCWCIDVVVKTSLYICYCIQVAVYSLLCMCCCIHVGLFMMLYIWCCMHVVVSVLL